MSSMCTLCQQFYEQHPFMNGHHILAPGNYMASIICAFPDGIFSGENWNCQTMSALRFIAQNETSSYFHASYQWMDSSIGVLAIPESYVDVVQQGGYLVMTWYKERGCTAQAWVMNDDDPPAPLKLATAEALLTWLQ